MNKVKTVLLLLACLTAATAHAAPAEYSNLKHAMIAALDAPGGVLRGYVIGPIAEQFYTRTGSTEPVTMAITTIKSFKEEGCKRLNVKLQQAGVMTTDGQKVPFDMSFALNLCRNGSPPTEGIDLERFGQAMGGSQQTTPFRPR